jgi:hypothetical protein
MPTLEVSILILSVLMLLAVLLLVLHIISYRWILRDIQLLMKQLDKIIVSLNEIASRTPPSVPNSDSIQVHFDEELIGARFDQAVLKYNVVTSQAISEMSRTQQALVREQQGLLEALRISFEEMISSLAMKLTPQRQYTDPPEPANEASRLAPPVTISRCVEESGEVQQFAAHSPHQARSDTTPTYAAKDSGQRFKALRDWVMLNIQRIVNRSYDPWDQPEDLVADAPRDLQLKVRMLDKDRKLLLLGIQDHQEHLAIFLPGAYPTSRHSDWFVIPKGTNERVEGTVSPALLEQVDGGFHVIDRGLLKQD